ncbi:MAG: thioredoxin domain-containing protein [Gammaproteobacteria bacterium]|nr:thioredoxin domain-containing protein [Gammaproteobacteria bacterium]MYH85733.1 thioredoxin domain-containing protein [Gammaproteobacteria bacterium]MYK04029.1 thioredoxin domain-containing protein [Gammaproteobacteria bacterium]
MTIPRFLFLFGKLQQCGSCRNGARKGCYTGAAMTESKQNSDLEQRLRAAEAAKEGRYDKRTEHLDETGRAIFINRLILEDSPYLLQHAHNPVNWYAWGELPFEVAKAENKPVFLSIGYSTCHWCHVMEVESFDNVEVAKVLNRHFISVKMDREQYPDVDEVYMTGVQCLSGHGGWPMSNFLLADGRPFFGATYFPPGQFIALLEQVHGVFTDRYDEIERSAASLHRSIQLILAERKAPLQLAEELPEKTLQALYQREDEELGGLAGAPKFPQEPLLLLALDQARRTGDRRAYRFAERSLRHMAMGGIYDHVGGGFHRYSVDTQWLVPHFEKMLYNQSQLAPAYLQAWRIDGSPFFRRVVEQTLDYVVREMQLPEGGFCSATDADSEGSEGVFFVWRMEELEELLDEQELDLLVRRYGVSTAGNFEGANILHLREPFPAGETGAVLDDILLRLRAIRAKREPPLRDDKVIAGWAGAMISALCQAAWALDRPDWLDAAERAANHLCRSNIDADGGLRRIWLHGSTSIDGQLEDYANLALALLQLFDVTGKQDYLLQASGLMKQALARFFDAEQNGFYLAPDDTPGPQLIRSRNASDGAQFSPVAAALECMIGLNRRSALLQESDAAEFGGERISACIRELAAAINANPVGHPSLLRVIRTWQSGEVEPMQTAGEGRARVLARRSVENGDQEALIRLLIAPGWHVTAPDQAGGDFVPLSLSLDDGEANWRLGELRCSGDQGRLATPGGESTGILQGEVELRAALLPAQSAESGQDEFAASTDLRLQVQLCDDRSCRLPEILRFRI